MSARRTAGLLVSVAALVIWAWSASTSGEQHSPSAPLPPPPTAAASGAFAVDALKHLEVKGRAPKTGYARDQFGQSWRDLDRNGCDQRNDVLRRDLTEVTIKPGTRNCVVLSGVLVSPYSGKPVPFERGNVTSREVPVDHVVALSDAWQKGAQQWTAELREQFANDFLELRATDLVTNSAKSDKDAASWLPPLKSSRCEFIARQIAVKKAYGLWVTNAERDAMRRVLDVCPTQRLPLSEDVRPD